MELMPPKIYVTSFDVEDCLQYVEDLEKIVSLYGPEQPILLQIESPGGDLTGYFILSDALKLIQNPVYTYCVGMACSAGFGLLVTGAKNGGKRICSSDALLMVHGVQLGLNGFNDLKDVEEVVRISRVRNNQFLNLIAKSIGLNNSDELEELVKKKTKSHDLYLTAQDSLDLNMIDMIGSAKLTPPIILANMMLYDNHDNCKNPDCFCKENEIPEDKPKKKKGKKK